MSKPPFSAPVVETVRLRLRRQRLEDFPDILAMWRSPQVARYVSGEPQTEETIWTKFLRKIGHWRLLGFGYWVVEDKASGCFLGEAGFGEYKRDLHPSLVGEPEIGWAFAGSAHGQGYATEAARAALNWADENFGQIRLSCMIGVENSPSLRVATKCGFEETRRALYHGDEVVILHRDVRRSSISAYE